MSIIRYILLVGCSLLAAGAIAQDDTDPLLRYRFSLDQEFYYNRLTGPGRELSNLNEGLHYLTLLNGDIEGELLGLAANLSIGIKATDDRTRDVKDLSLTTLRGTLAGEHMVLTLGDVFETFSQYTLSTALKGGSLRLMPGGPNDLQLLAVYGIAYPRWDSFLADRETDAVKREVMGLRLEQPFGDLLRVGVSGVYSDDSDPLFPTDRLYNNKVLGADLAWEIIEGLTLESEAAYSMTDESTGGSEESYEGSAYSLTLTGQGGPSRVRLEYERISPDFFTAGGSAVNDREKMKASWRYQMTQDTTMRLAYLYYHDNLDHAGVRTDHHKADIGFTFRRFMERRYAVLDLRYRADYAERPSRESMDHYFTIGHRDRFGIVDVDTNLGYTVYDTDDAIRDAQEYVYNTTLSSRHTVRDVVLKPQLYLGGWTSQDELADETDQIWENSLGLGVEVPNANVTCNVRVGQHRLQKDDPGALDSERIFTRFSLYYRPERLQQLGRALVIVEVGYNDLDYTGTSRDYAEFTSLLGLRFEL